MFTNMSKVTLVCYSSWLLKSAIEALDEPSSKSFHVSEHDMLQSEPLISIPSALPLYDSVGLGAASSVVPSESSIEPSLSTFDTGEWTMNYFNIKGQIFKFNLRQSVNQRLVFQQLLNSVKRPVFLFFFKWVYFILYYIIRLEILNAWIHPLETSLLKRQLLCFSNLYFYSI